MHAPLTQLELRVSGDHLMLALLGERDGYLRVVEEAFPEARIIVRGIDQGPPVKAPLEVELYGPNLDVLKYFQVQVFYPILRKFLLHHLKFF